MSTERTALSLRFQHDTVMSYLGPMVECRQLPNVENPCTHDWLDGMFPL